MAFKLKLLMLIFLTLNAFVFAQKILAAEGQCPAPGILGNRYCITTTIPGTDITQGRQVDFSIAYYISQLFYAGLAVVGVTALAAIMWHGVMYTISAGNQARMTDARDGITQAIYGLLLLLGAYLILYTINPALVTNIGGLLENVPSIPAAPSVEK